MNYYITYMCNLFFYMQHHYSSPLNYNVLNAFFDLVDDLHEETIINNTSISWYSYTNVAASGDYIRAVSKYYNEPEFSNVSINMSVDEADDYNMDKGTCFGKVFILFII